MSYAIGHLRITHEEIEQAKEDGVDIVAIKQEELRQAFREDGMEIEFKPFHRPPLYVIYEEHPSVNFRIYPKQ
jgi:hypothetical protein